MNATSFDLDACVFVEIEPLNPLKPKHILVPGSLLRFRNPAAVLEKQHPPRPQPLDKNIPILKAITTDLKDFQVLEKRSLVTKKIAAHAVARSSYDPDTNRSIWATPPIDNDELTFSTGDQFFLMGSFSSEPKAAKYSHNKVISLQTGMIGSVRAASLLFYPHAKVVEEFEWTTASGDKVLNKVGDLLTIGSEIWQMNWDPQGQKKMNDPVTFGRNTRTGYSGIIRIRVVAELEPEEFEAWRRTHLLPQTRGSPSPEEFEAWRRTHILPQTRGSPSPEEFENWRRTKFLSRQLGHVSKRRRTG